MARVFQQINDPKQQLCALCQRARLTNERMDGWKKEDLKGCEQASRPGEMLADLIEWTKSENARKVVGTLHPAYQIPYAEILPLLTRVLLHGQQRISRHLLAPISRDFSS